MMMRRSWIRCDWVTSVMCRRELTQVVFADALPNGRLRVLDGQVHVVPPEILAPVLTEFITD
jgi:hypothetical protein